jgi:hypothetical protein
LITRKLATQLKIKFISSKSWSCSGYNITISTDKEHRTIIDHQKIGYTIKDQVYKQQKLELLRIHHNYQSR